MFQILNKYFEFYWKKYDNFIGCQIVNDLFILESMWKSIKRYHNFYKRKGFYPFLRAISLKFALIMGGIVLGLLLFEYFTPGMGYYFDKYTSVVSDELVLSVFFASETILGLIPPDLFIVWGKQFPHPYGIVTLLAFLSYGAGMLAYYLGYHIGAWKKISYYITIKFADEFKMLRSWGGVIVVFAALFPLPFSTMCLGAGMLKYPFKALLILGLFRLVRFYAYAAVLYQIV